MTKPDTTFIAEPGTLDMTTTAVIDAPADKVYRAFTEPDLVAQWWGPPELKTRIETFDPTAGGRWRIVHIDPDGNEYGFNGVVHSVVPNQRIIQTFEFEGLPGHVCLQTLTLEETDGETKVTEHAVYQSVEDRDGMADSGARDFAPIGMAQLAEVVSKL
jgi:uncharacterized protein YndB with AHSA1/START domain